MRKFTFRSGIHPLHDIQEGKGATRNKPIRTYVAKTVSIPMDMHIGAPSKPVVKAGDRVLMGQMIAEAVEPWRDALLSLLNVEHAALLGAQFPAMAGLDVAYHFDKARALFAGEAVRG